MRIYLETRQQTKRMNNYKKLLFVTGAISAIGGVQARNTENRNIIMILVDDYGWKDVGCYGSEYYETPNIDQLAKDGVLFTNGYANCPVSSPSRASLMTGKYTTRHGITEWIGAKYGENWRTKTLKQKEDERTRMLKTNFKPNATWWDSKVTLD